MADAMLAGTFGSVEEEVAALRAALGAQAEEIERLRTQRGEGWPAPRRRDLLKGVGLVGGLAALGAVGAVNPKQASTAMAAPERENQQGHAPVFLFLKADGQDVQGESSHASFGNLDTANSIECVFYKQRVHTSAVDGRAASRQQYEPLVIRKRIDRSSPRLMQALVQRQAMEGLFHFFRPNPEDGSAQPYYTVEIKGARVASVEQYVPEVSGQGVATPPLEEVSFVFSSIHWVDAINSTSFEDSAAASR